MKAAGETVKAAKETEKTTEPDEAAEPEEAEPVSWEAPKTPAFRPPRPTSPPGGRCGRGPGPDRP